MGYVGHGRGKYTFLMAVFVFPLPSSALYFVINYLKLRECEWSLIFVESKDKTNGKEQSHQKETEPCFPAGESESRRGRSKQLRVPFHFRRLVNYTQVAMNLEINLLGKSRAPESGAGTALGGIRVTEVV